MATSGYFDAECYHFEWCVLAQCCTSPLALGSSLLAKELLPVLWSFHVIRPFSSWVDVLQRTWRIALTSLLRRLGGRSCVSTFHVRTYIHLYLAFVWLWLQLKLMQFPMPMCVCTVRMYVHMWYAWSILQISRTVKFLTGVCSCRYILSKDWVVASVSAGMFVGEWCWLLLCVLGVGCCCVFVVHVLFACTHKHVCMCVRMYCTYSLYTRTQSLLRPHVLVYKLCTNVCLSECYPTACCSNCIEICTKYSRYFLYSTCVRTYVHAYVRHSTYIHTYVRPHIHKRTFGNLTDLTYGAAAMVWERSPSLPLVYVVYVLYIRTLRMFTHLVISARWVGLLHGGPCRGSRSRHEACNKPDQSKQEEAPKGIVGVKRKLLKVLWV